MSTTSVNLSAALAGPVQQAIRPTSVPHLDLITGSIELANADLMLCDVKGRELTLERPLREPRSRYDVISLKYTTRAMLNDGRLIHRAPSQFGVK